MGKNTLHRAVSLRQHGFLVYVKLRSLQIFVHIYATKDTNPNYHRHYALFMRYRFWHSTLSIVTDPYSDSFVSPASERWSMQAKP